MTLTYKAFPQLNKHGISKIMRDISTKPVTNIIKNVLKFKIIISMCKTKYKAQGRKTVFDKL